jgi:hypothetical protein
VDAPLPATGSARSNDKYGPMGHRRMAPTKRGGKSLSAQGASSRSRNAVLRPGLHDEARDQGAIEPVGDYKRVLEMPIVVCSGGSV